MWTRSEMDSRHIIDNQTGTITIEPITYPWYQFHIFNYYRPTIRITLERLIKGEIVTKRYDFTEEYGNEHYGYKLIKVTCGCTNDEILTVSANCEASRKIFATRDSLLTPEVIKAVKYQCLNDDGDGWTYLRPIK